ncbi:MAG: PQQ-dependent sugar dehydrogenase [Planctomycetota bacterium]
MLALCLTLALAQDSITLQRIVEPNAGIEQPTDLVCRPGDDRIYVVERAGHVEVVDPTGAVTSRFLDLTTRIEFDGAVGLRSLAFHPDYESNGQVYVWYDAPNGTPGVDGVLARMLRDVSAPDRVDPASHVELLRVPQDGRSHGGGALRFGPDGMLYLGIGDGQPGGDPNCRAQDTRNLLGTMIRIDVDGGMPYAIPVDNPFLIVPGARPEIIHYGLRHPWKWCFDSKTGDLWIADVGEVEREEVNFVRAGEFGKNFGWSVLEGTTCAVKPSCPGEPPCAATGLTPPVFEYEHALGCSITGGVVYRGSQVPDLFGEYLFVDFCSGQFWSAKPPVNGAAAVTPRGTATYPTGANLTLAVTLAVDGSGEILVADYLDGEIYRVLPPCLIEPLCRGDRNASGGRGRLVAYGSTSIAKQELTFELSGIAPSAASLLFYGPVATSTTLGNGTLCVEAGTTPVVRAGFGIADDVGRAVFATDLGATPFAAGPSRVEPGSTWYFQAWYRDVRGPLGATFNLSGALRIVFCP